MGAALAACGLVLLYIGLFITVPANRQLTYSIGGLMCSIMGIMLLTTKSNDDAKKIFEFLKFYKKN